MRRKVSIIYKVVICTTILENTLEIPKEIEIKAAIQPNYPSCMYIMKGDEMTNL